MKAPATNEPASKWRRPKTDNNGREIKDDELEEYQIEDIREEIERLDIEKKNFEMQKRLAGQQQQQQQQQSVEQERLDVETRLGGGERPLEPSRKANGRIATNGSLGKSTVYKVAICKFWLPHFPA